MFYYASVFVRFRPKEKMEIIRLKNFPPKIIMTLDFCQLKILGV